MPTHYDPARLVDLRSKQVNPPPAVGQDGKPKPRYALTKGKVTERDPKKVTGIVVHQTACVFGVTEAMVKKQGGDRDMAKYMRFLNIPAHAIASQTGKFVVHAPLTWYAYHGHGFNDHSLGLEMEASLPGLRNGKTWNGKPASPTGPEFIAGCRSALGYLYEEGRRAGMPIEYVWAHRQSTQKPSDPGQELWEEVVINFGIKELGLKPQYDLVLKNRQGVSGKPIPVEWDPHGVGRY